MRYNNILFDLDGTLTDSLLGVTKSVQYALEQYGIKTELEELKSFIGPPLQQSFSNLYGFSEEEAFRAVRYFRDYYREKGVYDTKLYPHIPELLEMLANRGVKLFLATSKATVFAKKVLAYYNLDCFFSTIAGANLDGSAVEKRDVIEKVIRSNNYISSDNAVMVGDREHDVLGAKTWDLNCIGVLYGYGSREELLNSGAMHLVATVRELQEYLTGTAPVRGQE